MSEKSILEQALLQVQTLEEAVKANAKGILASTMKQELNELLKEEEEEEVESEEETTNPEEEEKDVAEQPDDEDSEEGDEPEVGDDESDELSADDEDSSKGIDSMDSGDDLSMDDDSDDDTMDDALPMGNEPSIDSDDDVMDMTSASDEEVLKIFKAMKPEDGVVVKKDGDDIELELDGDEYIIKLDGEESEMDEESLPMEDEELSSMGDEGSSMEDEESSLENEETLYEIELDEEEEEETKEEEEKDSKEIEAHESSRTFAAQKKGNGGTKFMAGSKGMNKNPGGAINEEVSKLKKQNDEYKKALVLFKEKLNEVAVFNANLAYATRLFTEHSTTKQEKLNILKRFDSVSTMNESKGLFKTIKAELETKKPVTETVVEKISNTPQTSTSKEVLAESKAYENPQFRRMKDSMSKIK